MANSKYEYVRSFEQPDVLLANTWIVVRIDGRAFSKLTAKYKFVKPNDRRALDLMNGAAEAVMRELPDLVLAYGNSDEFSFVFHKDCTLFERRASKLTTTIVSTFSSYYVFQWNAFFPDTPLTPPLPSFDGRAVCYPSDANLRDYMSWRQVDCHINNLYNTTFWTLVQQGHVEPRAAEQRLSGTVSSDKNEILFSEFGINYNNEPEIYKKGSVLYRDFFPIPTQSSPAAVQAPPASPPLAHPRPRSQLPRPMSQPIERTAPVLRDSPNSTASTTARGPTFLSTSTTPSPPPSPPLSIPAFPNSLQSNPNNHYPQNLIDVKASSNGYTSVPHTKAHLLQLTPLPLPPPTLKPTSKPPSSLKPPNLTSKTNTSPLVSPDLAEPIPPRTKSNKKPVSHSASASLANNAARPATGFASNSKPPLTRRSPSLSILEAKPPEIPLRISSIPMNNKPRKLSLPSAKSYSMLKNEEKENPKHGQSQSHQPRNHFAQAYATPNSSDTNQNNNDSGINKDSPPLQTMKELPSPPIDDLATRHAVMGSEPQAWTTSPVREHQTDPDSFSGPDSPTHGEMERVITNPVFPNIQRSRSSHSRLCSVPSRPFMNFDDDNVGEQRYLKREEGETGESTPRAEANTTATMTKPLDFAWSSPPRSKGKGKAPVTAMATSKPSTSTSAGQPNIKPKAKSHDHHYLATTNTDSHSKQQASTITANTTEEGGWAAAATTKTNGMNSSPLVPTTNKKEKKKNKSSRDATDSGGKEGRPAELSRTQRDKDRKKRTKASIIIEHVDIIKDEFWERRPWILSGRTS